MCMAWCTNKDGTRPGLSALLDRFWNSPKPKPSRGPGAIETLALADGLLVLVLVRLRLRVTNDAHAGPPGVGSAAWGVRAEEGHGRRSARRTHAPDRPRPRPRHASSRHRTRWRQEQVLSASRMNARPPCADHRVASRLRVMRGGTTRQPSSRRQAVSRSARRAPAANNKQPTRTGIQHRDAPQWRRLHL